MIKTIAIVFLCYMININVIHGYPDQKCYVCDQACDHPGAGTIQSCSDSENGALSGKYFVNGALDKKNESGVYHAVEADLFNYGTTIGGINDTAMPSWESLTQWVCYVAADKRRGCLVMGKGLCHQDKSLLGQLTSLANKLTSIMESAKKTVGKMFDSSTATLTSHQKENITYWMAGNYLSKLVNNSNGAQYQLDYCCDGNSCNSFASTIQKSAVMIIVLFLSTLILV